ncbi:MAG: hypothetical protein RL354_557 [Planctomycetota bacterium]|jgi:hypothetical protein
MTPPTPIDPPRAADPRAALAGALDTLAQLAAKADETAYAQGLAFGFHSPLGAHVRHCIDHVDALLHGIASGEICYDRRERGTAIEHDRTAGLAAAAERAVLVRAIGDAMLDSSITVHALTTPNAPEMLFDSTVAREVLYVFHHTVHHTALMSAQATNMGIQPDPKSGRAPATLANDARR